MRIAFKFLLAGCVVLGVPASGCAMTLPSASDLPCTVSGAALLPAAFGGEQGLCAQFGHAAAGRLPHGSRVELHVESAFKLTAVVVPPDGRPLTPVTTSASDRMLSARSVRMLADALVTQVRPRQP